MSSASGPLIAERPPPPMPPIVAPPAQPATLADASADLQDVLRLDARGHLRCARGHPSASGNTRIHAGCDSTRGATNASRAGDRR
eukprot:4100304-Pyramimonas_sp.AAC.1